MSEVKQEIVKGFHDRKSGVQIENTNEMDKEAEKVRDKKKSNLEVDAAKCFK